MNHATFEIGEVLFDRVHGREVRILEDIELPHKVFVESIKGPETYTIKKKWLFTADEINRALGRKSAREDLQKSREYRRKHVNNQQSTTMNQTSQKIAETVHELNEEIRHVDGVHLESSQIGIVDTVTLHQDNGSGEIVLWTSEETTRFSKKMVFNAILEVVEDLNKAKDAIEHHIEK